MNLGHLISENGKDASLGRVAFWVVFGTALYLWLYLKRDLYDYQAQVLIALLLYNLGKKGMNAWRAMKEKTGATV